ncbi:unnamed protein product [Prorocentrum cordatum]|uniref:Uncharacterized protein n=1 Tax=Prorocentrum cordatum TaxID=2364126 RepID=A0ABN9TCI7_9DINO|nr:unnamed protein product [Polarella glacialis]
MADEQPRLRRELRQASVTFDPFVSLPRFVDDGTLETRLRWEATKPGRLKALLDANAGQPAHALLLQKIEELGLLAAAQREARLAGGRGAAPAGDAPHWAPFGGKDAAGLLFGLLARVGGAGG